LIFKNFEYAFVDSWKAEDIVELYKSAGWWNDNYDPSGINNLIKGSFAFVIITDKNNDKTVGMGRLLSDGVSDAYIQDVVVLSEYREKGLGKRLIQLLIDHCISKGIIWIGLIAEPGQEDFYLKLKFDKMVNYVPMKYKI